MEPVVAISLKSESGDDYLELINIARDEKEVVDLLKETYKEEFAFLDIVLIEGEFDSTEIKKIFYKEKEALAEKLWQERKK